VTTIGYALTLDEAQARAHEAALSVIDSLGRSFVEHKHQLFSDKAEAANALREMKALTKDEGFKLELEAAFVAWLSRTHTLLPPKGN